MLAYELPFVLAVLVPVIARREPPAGGHLLAPAAGGGALGRAGPGGRSPVHAGQADAGAVRPAGGRDGADRRRLHRVFRPAAGVFKLTRAMMLFTMPVFLVARLLRRAGAERSVARGAALAVPAGWLVVVILVRNTAPRVRIDQAMRFFWGPVTAVAARRRGAGLRWAGEARVSFAIQHPDAVAERVPPGRERVQQLRHRDPGRADPEVRPGAVRHRAGAAASGTRT